MKPLGLGEHGKITTKREAGRWVARCRLRDFSGRERQLRRTGTTAAAANRALLDAIKEALRGQAAATYSKTTRLEVAAEGWLAMFEGLVARGNRSPTTLDIYRYEVERTITPAIGRLRVGELAAPRLDNFVQGVLAEKGYSTAKLCRQVLSGICGWLVRQGALEANPVRDLTPLEASSDKTPRALDAAGVRAWLTVIDTHPVSVRNDLPDIARFMLGTGLRLGETLGATWQDVDLAEGVLCVERTIVRVKGKGLLAKTVKSKASERILRLPEWLVVRLRARRVRLGAFDGPIFPSKTGGWRDRNNVGKAFRTVRATAPEFAWVRPHTYRKTVATLLDTGGATAREIADQLGHSRVSMTQDRYLGRRAVGQGNAALLNAHDPDAPESE